MMTSFRQWLSRPVDYAWVVSYFQANTALTTTRKLIGLSCWMFSALYVLAAIGPATGPTGFGLVVVLVNAACTAVVGLAWIVGPWPSKRMSLAFVAYADVGLGLVVLLLHNALAVVPLTILFGVASSYSATFHSPRVFAVHHTVSLGVCTAVFARAVTEDPGYVPESAKLMLALTYGVLIVMVVFLAPISIYRLQLHQHKDVTAAFFDPLTGLRNRRGLTFAARDLAVGQSALVAMVVDIDDFKKVNDLFGHHVGDTVIRRTAEAIDTAFPSPSITARTGGEEYAVVTSLPVSHVLAMAETLRDGLARGSNFGATLSVGIAAGETVERLLVLADLAMYEAKAAGGDCVVVDHRGSTAPDPMY
ncbi:MAG: GGDEF domain-containing protein [Rhodococcus sp. (in: high G+C Gram-positive bacteria)]